MANPLYFPRQTLKLEHNLTNSLFLPKSLIHNDKVGNDLNKNDHCSNNSKEYLMVNKIDLDKDGNHFDKIEEDRYFIIGTNLYVKEYTRFETMNITNDAKKPISERFLIF